MYWLLGSSYLYSSFYHINRNCSIVKSPNLLRQFPKRTPIRLDAFFVATVLADVTITSIVRYIQLESTPVLNKIGLIAICHTS